jgi:acetoin utilization protein AcuB
MPDAPIISQIMSCDVATVTPTDPIRIAIERMRERGCRRLPVLENGRLVGIVTDRDLRRATNSPFVLRERWYDEFVLDHISIKACMTANPLTVTPRTNIVEAARLMRDRKIGGLPVIENKNLVGIITETDLLNYLIQLLEQ